MKKPTNDKPDNSGTSRLREFTRHERESGTHPAIDLLRSRPQPRGAENRVVAEFARIERGQVG